MESKVSVRRSTVKWIRILLIAVCLGVPAIIFISLAIDLFRIYKETHAPPHEAAGPLPWCSPEVKLTRLQATRGGWNHRYEKTFWDEGAGPIEPKERDKVLVDTLPANLMQRLKSEKFSTNGSTAKGTVVSLNPDVMIVTCRKPPPGSSKPPFKDWVSWNMDPIRQKYVEERREFVDFRDYVFGVYAGVLCPWSDEMYVVSTDPAIKTRNLDFVNQKAIIDIPGGRLLLIHHDDDVDVTRE